MKKIKGSLTLPAPLVLARQGSFFVNQRSIHSAFPAAAGVLEPGHISVKGMYVQYQVPQALAPGLHPLILVHGAGHSGKTYEETPDGRMGWAEYFVRCGAPVYVVDHSGRARSGFDPTPTNQALLQGRADLVPAFRHFTNEQAWVTFRLGPAAFTPFAATLFPVDARDQYFAQLLPNTETSYPEGGQNTVDALAALLERTGPAVLLVHSQSGLYGIQAAAACPDLVKALVCIEPRDCMISDAQVQAVFTRVPLLTLFGDFFGLETGVWPGRMQACLQAVERIRAAGGKAENIYLPQRGISGNSHMLMMDRNNQQLAGMILDWLRLNAG